MIPADIMDELAVQLSTITGLRAYGWPLGSVSPPAAIVGYPTEIVFDETYGRGFDIIRFPVVVVVGRASERSTRDLYSAYTSGSGSTSVKAVVEGGTYTSFDVVHVQRGESDVYTLAGVEHIAVVFDLEVAGPGTS